jgi:hypothetical protein
MIALHQGKIKDAPLLRASATPGRLLDIFVLLRSAILLSNTVVVRLITVPRPIATLLAIHLRYHRIFSE